MYSLALIIDLANFESVERKSSRHLFMFLIHNKTAEVDITLIDITNCAKKSRNFLRKFKTLFFNEQIIPTRSVITSGWRFTLQKNRFMLDEKVLAKHLKICYLF